MQSKSAKRMDFYESMASATLLDDRTAALRRLIESHGFDKFAVMLQINPMSQTPHAFENFHLIDQREPSWAEAYTTENLARIDPTWSADPSFLLPRFWDDIPQTDIQKKHMERAAIDGGATNGFSVIVPAPGGDGGGFSCSGRDKRAEYGVALEILSAVQIYRIYAQADYAAEAAASINLSEGDIRILRLLWEGYSSAAIAALEDCKEAAVNQRFYDIRQKLQVGKNIQVINRAFAVGALP